MRNNFFNKLFFIKISWIYLIRDGKSYFISSLPKVNDLTSYLCNSYRFLKYVIFTTVPSSRPAIVMYFGLSSNIVSNRNVKFISRFWIALFELLGSKLKFSITKIKTKSLTRWRRSTTYLKCKIIKIHTLPSHLYT